MIRKLLFILVLIVYPVFISGQVKVRLFSDKSPESAVFSVIKGEYEINVFDNNTLKIAAGETVIITKYSGKLALKTRFANGFVCDSVEFAAKTSNDLFSIRINGALPVRQYYSGSLKCLPDMSTLIFINTCDIDKYISGVVEAEGGNGKNIEYYKSQAVIARTYIYRNSARHQGEKYNVCDNTHCQVFNGLSSDSILNEAALETKGMVILGRDSTLIISAFHSNCGGETSSSEDVWLTDQPYLKSVYDPYCTSSKNAEWEKNITLTGWTTYLRSHGFSGKTDDPGIFNFSQDSRLPDYSAGFFTLPLRIIRSDMNLRSTFFSVFARPDSIKLKGRGYGHGVGLCQEGAMIMAARGFSFREIIDFYYHGVIISDIKNAVTLPGNSPTITTFGGL
jgi:stage II sporulation protein D